uniref:Secreted protein n=1 Tax=Pseudo-nitzschia australis TaxID=44445 RepID=A0A7S4EKA6_9STRA
MVDAVVVVLCVCVCVCVICTGRDCDGDDDSFDSYSTVRRDDLELPYRTVHYLTSSIPNVLNEYESNTRTRTRTAIIHLETSFCTHTDNRNVWNTPVRCGACTHR